MFAEFANQTWTTSATGVTVTNNTDTSIDGSSKKIVWTEANKSAVLTFDSVTLSDYEELSLHLYPQNSLSNELFTITIENLVQTFKKTDLRPGKWNHVLIDCSTMTTPVTTITITSLIPGFILFIDYAGYRKVTYNSDVDIITALKNHINLNYGVETALSESAVAGDSQIYLTTSGVEGYINESSLLELDNGLGVTEIVELIDREGKIKEPLINDFAINSVVRVICPVRSEDYDDLQPDPICGIKVYDMKVDRQRTTVWTMNGSKTKEYLGALGVLIYIDCKSKKKLLQLSREYNKKYGEAFQFLLDGEQVEIYLESSAFADDVIGNNPRMAYYYLIEPQPYLLLNPTSIATINLQTEVKTN